MTNKTMKTIEQTAVECAKQAGLWREPTDFEIKENPRAIEISNTKIEKLTKFAELTLKRGSGEVNNAFF